METDDLRELDGFIAQKLFGYRFRTPKNYLYIRVCSNCGRELDDCTDMCFYSISYATVGLVLEKLSAAGITYTIKYKDSKYTVWLRQNNTQAEVQDYSLPYALCKCIHILYEM